MGRNSNLTVPPGLSAQDRRFADAIKENLDVILGHRGDPLERAVTFRDLIDARIIQLASGVSAFGSVQDINPVVNDIPDLEIPPAPTGLSASGAFQNIVLSWNLQLYKGHSIVEVFRHTSDSISSATLVAQVSGFTGVYADPVGSNATFYYWVRAVNQNGVQGPFNSSTGTLGQTSPDVSFLLTLLTGEITSSQLATALSTPIGNLPTDTQTAINDLQSQVNAIGTVSQWSSSTTYSIGDLALYPASNSKLYRSKTNSNQNNQPSGTSADTTYWEFVGTGSTLGDVVADNTSSITQINFLDASSTSAAAQKIAALDSTVTHPTTGVTATASAVGGLTTRVTAAENTIGSNSTTITSLSSDVTALQNTVNDSNTGVAATSTALGGLTTRVTQTESDISGIETTITSQSSDITALESTVNDSSTGVSATATALDSLTTTVTQQGTDISTTASDLSTLSTTVAGNTASISTQSTSINGLEAKYVVKVDVNGAVAGYGLASTTNAAGNIESEFIVNADRFAIMRGGSNTAAPSVPFVVQSSSTTIGGETVPAGVYIEAAFIKNGSIQSAKIADAAIDNAKIANLNANKINAGKINTSRLNIDGATLTADPNTGALQVNEIAANKVTSGTIATSLIDLDGSTITSDAQGRIKIKDLGVDTLQIKGNAVTIPSSFFLASQINAQSETQVADVSYTSTGAPAFIIGSCQGAPSSGRSHSAMLRIKRNGSTIVQQRLSGGTLTFALTCSDNNPTAGTRTYTMHVENLGTNPKASATTTHVTLRSLAVFEVKK